MKDIDDVIQEATDRLIEKLNSKCDGRAWDNSSVEIKVDGVKCKLDHRFYCSGQYYCDGYGCDACARTYGYMCGECLVTFDEFEKNELPKLSKKIIKRLEFDEDNFESLKEFVIELLEK